MKVTWPENVMFEKAELPCQEKRERGDKMMVEPDADQTFIITIFDGTRTAKCVVSLNVLLALGELVTAVKKPREFDDE